MESTLLRLRRDPHSIAFMANPTMEEQMAAVAAEPSFIRYIKRPCPKAQIREVEVGGAGMTRLIRNPSQEAKRLAESMRWTE